MEPQTAAAATGVAQLPHRLARRLVARRPSTLQMVKEALQARDEKKGASLYTIKQFILAKYPTENPNRLKYLLRQALNKGLRSGMLVRPRNSNAVGASGIFMLAPKKPKQPQPKQQLGQAKPDREQSPKPGRKGTTKAPQAPLAPTQQGAVEQQPTAVKQKPKAKPVDAELQAAVKPRSNGPKRPRAAKAAGHPPAPVTGGSSGDADHSQDPKKGPSGPPRAAQRSQAPGTGRTKPPRAADHTKAPGKGYSGSCVAAAAEDAGGGESESSVGAGAKGLKKAPGGKSKGKVLRGAQQEVPKAEGGQGQARKSRVTPGARKEQAKKVARPAERKAS